jgi:hypothetical protein
MKCKVGQNLRRNQPALITMANSRLGTKGTSTKALIITSIFPIPALYYTRDTSIAYWSCMHRIIVKVWARKAPAYASFTIEGVSAVRIEPRLHGPICIAGTDQDGIQVALSGSGRVEP